MNRATWGLVLLVSSAHALVHVYELSLPSAEQLIAAEYQVGTDVTGLLGTTWRLPWGLGALLAGWLVDRYGARRLLAVYLLGCGGMCLLAGIVFPLPVLFLLMFLMGAFACIYHPAGLALISYETNPANRPRALGIHGIFGSAGIGLAPFLAGVLLAFGFGWRQYYFVLAIPGVLLGVVFASQWRSDRGQASPSSRRANSQGLSAARNGPHAAAAEDEAADWASFFTLTTIAMFMGFTYSGVLNFLPRYLAHVDAGLAFTSRAGFGNCLAGGVLLIGCFGQYLAGRWARPQLLERQLALVLFASVPCLLGMAAASGWQRIVAAGVFALIHFMHQPLYNSLIAKYTPRRRRSLCYGFSFAMGFGIGSTGAAFAGFSHSDRMTYGTLAAVTLVAGCLAVVLSRRHWRRDEKSSAAGS